MATERLTERMAFSGGKVDRTGPYPIVRDVLLCGPASANGNDYLRECFPPDVKLYENRPIFIDHGQKGGSRGYRDKLAWVENERRRASDGMPVGDLGVNPKHAEAESFLWAAEHKPDFCGMSHVADAELRHGTDGRKKVFRIECIESVDVVIDPATTKGLTAESRSSRVKTTINVGQILRLKRLAEDFCDMEMDAPADDVSADDGISAAFKQAIMSVIDGAMDGGDAKEALKKIKKLLDSHADVNGDGKVDDADAEDAATEESKKKKPEADGKRILEALDVAERIKFKADRADLEIIAATDPAGRERVAKRLMESAKGDSGTGMGPRSNGRQPIQESKGKGGGDKPSVYLD
jgi:hypothetical protein